MDSNLKGPKQVSQIYSDAEAISTSDCQSMMSLRKGWMDGRIGFKVLYILALECSQFLEKK